MQPYAESRCKDSKSSGLIVYFLESGCSMDEMSVGARRISESGTELSEISEKMKDSDILAEKKRSNDGNYAKVGVGTAAGAGIGLGAAKIAQHLGYLGGGKGALGLGAAAGGLIGAGSTYLANRNKIKDNNFYNQRLGYAQRQANRRERKDFVSNNTNREGYSY